MVKSLRLLSLCFFSSVAVAMSEEEDEILFPETLTFRENILPLVQNRCNMCHSPGSGMPVWEDYETLFANRAWCASVCLFVAICRPATPRA